MRREIIKRGCVVRCSENSRNTAEQTMQRREARRGVGAQNIMGHGGGGDEHGEEPCVWVAEGEMIVSDACQAG